MDSKKIAVERLTAHLNEYGRLSRLHRHLGNGRLAVVAVGLAAIWWVESNTPQFTWPAAFALAVGFVAATQLFARIESSRRWTVVAASYYSAWLKGTVKRERVGQAAETVKAAEGHPFAEDLDMLESKGLFDRLNTASTLEGMRQLLGLLTTPAEAGTVRDRQQAVKELVAKIDLRERYFVAGSLKVPYIRTEQVLHWASKDIPAAPGWLRRTYAALSFLVVACLTVVALNPSPPTYALLGGALLLEFAVWKATRNRVQVASLEAERLHLDFSELCDLLTILEGQEFQARELQAIAQILQDGKTRASQTLRTLCHLTAFYEARRNQIVALLGPLVLFETQLSLMVENWRFRHSSLLSEWIAAVARFEAYSSVATFAFEHPEYEFPQLEEKGPVLRARNLAHPLLDEKAVANDVVLVRSRSILLVSGANMAGKSTLLRTIGSNIALAYAGAPVRASSFTISPLALIASIRVTDSLRLGESRFSAELRKIRVMLESMRDGTPTIVLIDELFGGTNSYDRYTGAVALAEHVLGSDDALAVFSTHDRNVTRWAEEHPDRIANAHFRDTLKDGSMTFDYKLRQGPATRGNAIDLMQMAGLQVTEGHPGQLG